MSLFEFSISYLSVIITQICLIKCYELISDKKKVTNKYWTILTILFTAGLMMANSYFINNFLRMFGCLAIFIITFFIIFREDIKANIFKAIVLYCLILVMDILISPLNLVFSIETFEELNALYILRAILTIFTSAVIYFVLKIKKINKFFKSLCSKIVIKHSFIFDIISLLILVTFALITFYNVLNFTYKIFFPSLILFMVFIILIILLIFQFFQSKKAEAKEEILLNFMTKYEKVLDEDKINRHEMLNNLLILRSFENKNSKEYKELLEKIIKEYENKNTITMKNLYKLPSGLKGIIYYKVNNVEELNINFILNISPDIDKIFKKIDSTYYYKTCKIMSILLDNAIEALNKTDNKDLLIDIYSEKESLNIYIENSCENNINLDKIKEKGFSTKGKNRGYGLYVVNNIIKSEDGLELNQYIKDNKFISELKIRS